MCPLISPIFYTEILGCLYPSSRSDGVGSPKVNLEEQRGFLGKGVNTSTLLFIIGELTR